MRYILNTSLLGLLLLWTTVALGANDRINETRTIKSKERFVTVQYKDMTVERYRVAWAGNVSVHVWETGGPAKPLEGKFVDDRQCHWDIVSRLDRAVFLINKSGKEFADTTRFNVITSPFANEGTKNILTPFGESCNSAERRFTSDINDAVRVMNDRFDALSDADFSKYKEQVKQDAQVLRIDDSQH